MEQAMSAEQPVSNPVSTSPYGHACAHCVRSKTKCVSLSGSTSCHRCHRLGKNCEPAPHTRRRGNRRREASGIRRERLEDKLDDLVTLLRARTAPSSQLDIPQGPIPQASTSTPSEIQEPLSPHFLPNHYAGTWTPSTNNAHRTPEVANGSRSTVPNPQGLPRPTTTNRKETSPPVPHAADYATSAFRLFQTRHLAYYPCVYIPPNTTVEEFQRDKPFVWLNMQAVLETSLLKQDELGDNIRQAIARRIVVEGEKSLDLLLGLLIYISWKHHFSRNGRSHMGVLANLAKALVSELRLDGPGDNVLPPLFSPSNEPMASPWITATTHSPEEMRTLLAAFVMSANVSTMLNYDYIHWHPEMERSAQRLGQNPECPGDEVLVVLARLSRISREAIKVMHVSSESVESVMVRIKPLQDTFERTRGSISADLLSNEVILSHLYNAEVLIHEIAFYHRPSPTSLEQPFEFRRAQYLLACLEAAKRVIENHLKLGMPQYTAISMHVLIHFMHAIQVLHRLSLLEEPWWDRAATEQSADVVSYLHRAIAQLSEAHAHVVAETGTEDSIWLRGADKLRQAFPKWCEGLASTGSGVATEETGFAPIDVNISDDSWFTDFFSTSAWAA